MDHILSYLDTYRALAIEFSDLLATPEITVFLCSSNAAFADNADWKSSYGFLFKLFRDPIDWKAMKQKMVTTSSTEAELLTLSNAAKEAIWWQRFFRALDFDPGKRLSIENDNLQTIRLLSNSHPLMPTKLRYMDIHQH